jgi:Rieske 2Fe-2S family protein
MISHQQNGLTLEQPFYTDESIFKLDVEKIIKAPETWHLVGHISRLPKAGDYFLVNIAGESIIVVRNKTGEINAFYNVCRHRGSRICLKNEGHSLLLVCPYHAWSYDLDGAIKVARDMPEGFDKSKWGLHECHAHVAEGLIFINLCDGPLTDFDDVYRDYMKYLKPHDLASAKIALRRVYPTPANWKLVYENFAECYHCVPSHPEYCTIHSPQKLRAFGAGKGSGSPEDVALFQDELNAWEKRAGALGHLIDSIDEADVKGPYFRSAGRYPIQEGYETESKGGQPVAPLMGHLKDFDGGQTAVSFSPFYTVIANPDYTIIFRFTPISVLETEVELTWLVRGDSEEGKDYNLEDLAWAWHATNIQDGEIVTNNQKGVLSLKYAPGPYAKMEVRINEFIRWYLNRLNK